MAEAYDSDLCPYVVEPLVDWVALASLLPTAMRLLADAVEGDVLERVLFIDKARCHNEARAPPLVRRGIGRGPIWHACRNMWHGGMPRGGRRPGAQRPLRPSRRSSHELSPRGDPSNRAP